MAEYTGHFSRRTWFSGMVACVMGRIVKTPATPELQPVAIDNQAVLRAMARELPHYIQVRQTGVEMTESS